MQEPHVIWDEFLKIAKEEAGSQVVETWFKAVTLEKIEIQSEYVSLKMPNNFVKNWIQEHYVLLLKKNLKRLLNFSEITIEFIAPPRRDPYTHTGHEEPHRDQDAHIITSPTYQPAHLDTHNKKSPLQSSLEKLKLCNSCFFKTN